MPKFEFKAYTSEGKLKEGLISAENKDAALKILQEQQLLVTYLAEKKIKFFEFIFRPRLQDVYIFTKQLSFLLKAATPLDEAVKALSSTASNPVFRGILIEVYNDLVSGIPFSKSLEHFPDVFDSYYIGLVKIGESIGALDETLTYVAEHIAANIKFRNRLIQAFIYPVFVLIILVAVLIALFYFVIPQINKLFVENNIPMPTITKIFQGISVFLTRFGIFAVIIFVSLIYHLYEYFKTREGKATLFNFMNGVPIFGPLLKNIYAGRFLESLHYLIKGGVPLAEALIIIEQSINHPIYESAIQYALEEVKKGRPLSESLAEFPDLFHSILIEGLRTAEKTGQLTEITSTIYQFYNETIENQVANLAEALQPVIIVILGGALGALEASLLIPLLNLTKYVQNF